MSKCIKYGTSKQDDVRITGRHLFMYGIPLRNCAMLKDIFRKLYK